jgi:hypothetical protein
LLTDRRRFSWQPDHSMQTRWERCTAGFFATLLTPRWEMALASTLTAEESFHYGRIENHFFRRGLAGTTEGDRNGRAARPHDRLRGVHYNRREPIGREGGFQLHGASRLEGCRTVTPLGPGNSLLPPDPASIFTVFKITLPHIATDRSLLSSDRSNRGSRAVRTNQQPSRRRASGFRGNSDNSEPRFRPRSRDDD